MKNLRILMILFNPVGKGTYWRALYPARSLAKLGHQVTVLATSKSAHFRFKTASHEQKGVTLVESPDLLWGSMRYGWDLYNVLARIIWSRQKQFDLVHAFESRPTVILPALYWLKMRDTKLIMDWCDWFGKGGSVEERTNWLIRNGLRPFETFFEDTFRTHAHGTTVINSFLRQRALQLGVDPNTIFHFPNGSNLEELKPISKDASRQLLSLPTETPIIGYIGAIFHQDAQLMADAFDLILQVKPNTKLLLAGYCNVNVENLVQDPQAIIRTGPLKYEEINRYLAACDVCWLPLLNTGANQGRYPLKINDYMAVGKPVIVTRVGDVASLVENQNFGYVSADQPDEFAKQTLKLLNNPFLQEEMGHRARQVAEESFSWDTIADDLAHFYYRILESS